MDLRTKKYIAIEQIMQLDEANFEKLEQMLKEVFPEKKSNLTQYKQELEEDEEEDNAYRGDCID